MALTSVWRDRHPVATQGPVPAAGGGAGGGGAAGGPPRPPPAPPAGAGRGAGGAGARAGGAGTTGGSTAKVSVQQGTQFSWIARRHPVSVLRKYAAANTEALAWVERFCADHGVARQHRPAYTYATSASGVHSVRAELEALHRAGIEQATWVDELPLPFRVRGAVLVPDQAQLDPLDLLDALAADARDHGAVIVEGARVHRVHGRAPQRVVTDAGDAGARTVVLATNMPVLDRGGFFARAKPARSYGLAFRTATQAVDGMYLSADPPTRSLRDAPAPDGDGSVLLVGGDGHKTGAATSELSHLDGLREWTHGYYPDAVETHAWSAQDYVPHHALPFVGPILPGTDGVLVAGGYSKWGMTNGVAAALALAGRILGGHQEWASAFDPWSTREIAGLPESARLNAAVAVELTTGWLRPLRGLGSGSPVEGAGEVRLDRLGLPTAVCRVDGIEHAVSAVCSHLGGIVRWNDAERSWDCPLHGSRFGPDGQVLEGPATCGLRRR